MHIQHMLLDDKVSCLPSIGRTLKSIMLGVQITLAIQHMKKNLERSRGWYFHSPGSQNNHLIPGHPPFCSYKVQIAVKRSGQ